ncbi:exonuclease SbcCD subunit D, partial [bacterium]
MVKIIHFADAHIDIATHGRRDPETGLPIRVLDFLKALDTIVDRAIAEKVDMVIFAGDAYKDRQPAPTFQREWGKRIIRLSNAAIPTLLLVGNHDLSPASGRAHTLQEFDTLQVPHVHVLYKPQFLTPADLDGVPVQVIGFPWVYRSGLMAAAELSGTDINEVNQELEKRLSAILSEWLDNLD